MDQRPLVIDRIDTGGRFVRRFGEDYPVDLALWLKRVDDDLWYLYIISSRVGEPNIYEGYLAATELARTEPELAIDPDQVRVVGLAHPVARAAFDFLKRYPTTKLARYRGPQFGGIGTEEVYIYPPVVAAADQG